MPVAIRTNTNADDSLPNVVHVISLLYAKAPGRFQGYTKYNNVTANHVSGPLGPDDIWLTSLCYFISVNHGPVLCRTWATRIRFQFSNNVVLTDNKSEASPGLQHRSMLTYKEK